MGSALSNYDEGTQQSKPNVGCKHMGPAGRRSSFYRFMVSLSFIELSKLLSTYRTFFGSIIFFFIERLSLQVPLALR